MDRKLPRNEEVQRLIRLSDAARATLQEEATSLKLRLDFPARIKSSLKKHPTRWLVASLAVGFLVSGLFFRRRPVVTTEQKKNGLLLTLLGLALTAARPFAKVWLTDQVKNHLLGRPGILTAMAPRGRSEIQPPI